MATLTGKLVADTYKALLKMIDNDVVTATEKQISDGLGGGTGIFIDQDGEIRASKYRVTAGTSSQFLKADGSLDSTSYLPSGTTTTSIPEGSNLYFTNSRVLNTTLNGFTAISGTVTSADSVLTAIEKIWWNIVNGGGGGGGGYVPYVGATQNLNLGEYGLLGGFVRFDTTPTTLAGTQGELFWDEDHSTIAIQMNSAKCVIGQDVYFYVKNQSGSTIPKGTAVGFAGTLGASGRLLIAPFLADGSQPSKYFMGLVAEDIANGDDGFVLEFGQIRQINTNAYNDGDILYVSPTVAGGLTTTIPEAPNNIITIAAVVHSASNGVLQVRVTLGSRLNEDELVYLDNLADKDALFYNNTTGRFENRDIYGTEGYLPIYDDIDILKDSIIYSDGVGIGIGTNILEPTAIATFFGNIDLVTGTYLTSDGFNLIGRGNLINQIEIGSQNASDYLTFIAGNSERARITAAGNFGIGLTNPSAPLHVKGSTYTNVIVDNNSATGGGSYLSYQNGTKKALFGLSGAFELNTGSDVAIASTIAGGGIKFYTNNSTTQAMGIVSSGNAYLGQAPTFLGLGTEFIVRGQASDGVLGVMDSTEAVKGLFISNSSLSWLGTYSNHPLVFRTNNTEWARISSVGNLLIGTIVDNATDKLQVNGTSYFGDNIVLADSKGIVSSGVNMLSRNNLNNQIIIGADGGINDNVAFYSGDLERMRLLANGRLAINKTTASYQVDVQGDVNVSGAFRVNGTIIPNGTVTSVAMSVPTGLVISGSPITSSGTLAVTYAVNYGIPTLTKQSDWDDAYTWVTNFPDQSSNAGKFLTTNGSVLSWASLVTGVSSVFGRTGAVTAQSGDYTTAQVTESGNLYYTDTRARLALSASAPLSYNNGTGAFSISQASGSTNGFLSSTDWNTFNNKQNALGYTPVPTTRTLTINGTSYDLSADRSWTIASGIGGSGTTNYIPKFTASTTIGNSNLQEVSGNLGLGVTPSAWSGFTALELQGGFIGGGASTYFEIGQNIYYDGSFRYKSTGASTIYEQNTGRHIWYNAPSGTAGNAISFTQAMTLDASGNLMVATTSASNSAGGRGNITIGGSSTSILNFQIGGSLAAYLYHDNNNLNILNSKASGALLLSTNSTEAMRINAGGNVSIGNTNNTYKLDVSGTGYFNGNASTTPAVIYNNANGASGTAQYYANYTSGATVIGRIFRGNGLAGTVGNGLNIDNYDGFQVRLNQLGGTGGSFNIMGGNVGIGTTSPSNGLLVINSTSATGVRFALESSGTMNGIVALGNNAISGLSTTDMALWTRGVMAFETGASGEKMRITSSGSVGIGTTSPSNKLHIWQGAGQFTGFPSSGSPFTFLQADYNASFLRTTFTLYNPTNGYDGDLGIGLTNSSNVSYTAMYLKGSTGNVGIGTTSPSSKLQIEGTGTGAWITLNRTDSGTNIVDFTQSGTRLGYIGYIANELWLNNTSATSTVFSTSGSERMRITSGGLVGIGTSSPTRSFQITRTSTAFINAEGSIVAIGSSDTELRLFGNNTETMTIKSGNVGIGSSSPSQKLTLSNTDADVLIDFVRNGTNRGTIGHKFVSGVQNELGITANYPTTIGFYTNGARRLYIDPFGKVGVNTTSFATSDYFKVEGQTSINGDLILHSSTQLGYGLSLPNASNTGEAVAKTWVVYSDARVKKNVSELNYGIDSIKKLKPISYNHHNSEFQNGEINILEKYKYEIGFIAQEVYDVIPEVVNPGNDTQLWTMNYERLTSVIVKGMQEQQVMIETNAEKIARLEKEVSFLKTKIA